MRFSLPISSFSRDVDTDPRPRLRPITRHIFPILKQRMPHFQLEHQEEHDAIHKGMHDLEALARRFKQDPSTYSPDALRSNLKSWGPLLFWHLDAEVESLKSDVLRRCKLKTPQNRVPRLLHAVFEGSFQPCFSADVWMNLTRRRQITLSKRSSGCPCDPPRLPPYLPVLPRNCIRDTPACHFSPRSFWLEACVSSLDPAILIFVSFPTVSATRKRTVSGPNPSLK